MSKKTKASKGKKPSRFILAVYTGFTMPGIERKLTVDDQNKLAGVPVAVDDLVWDGDNEWRLNITDVHPLIVDGIRRQSDFDVTDISNDFDLGPVMVPEAEVESDHGRQG